MPEGDAVYLTARRLDRGLAGRVLTGTDFRWPSLATVDLAGATVYGTGTHGKHLLTRLEHDGSELTLHTHLKMEGAWRVHRDGERWKRPAHQARVVLGVEGAHAVGFSLGIVELLATADEGSVVGHLGPDLLGPDWSEDVALSRLRAEPGSADTEDAAQGGPQDRAQDSAQERAQSPSGAPEQGLEDTSVAPGPTATAEPSGVAAAPVAALASPVGAKAVATPPPIAAGQH